MAAPQKLAHLLQLADQGPTLRAALAEEVAELIGREGGEASVNTADVTDWKETEKMIGQAVERFGPVDGELLGVVRRQRMALNFAKELDAGRRTRACRSPEDRVFANLKEGSRLQTAAIEGQVRFGCRRRGTGPLRRIQKTSRRLAVHNDGQVGSNRIPEGPALQGFLSGNVFEETPSGLQRGLECDQGRP